jgi:hypothetical protein
VTIDGSDHGTSTTSISMLLTNGSYPYTVSSVPGYYAPTPSSGQLKIAGSAATVAVSYGRPSYSLVFTESGLPKGTSWQVTVGGVTVSGDGTSLAIAEPNGSYSYTIGGIAGWEITSGTYRGSVSISGAGATVATTWGQTTYVVTFEESGLKSGSTWSVKMDGTTVTTTAASLIISATNGTFSYTASSSGYTSIAGKVTVDGAGVSVDVAFKTAGGVPAAALPASNPGSTGGASATFAARAAPPA